MEVKFAFDTAREIAAGGLDRKVRAVLTFGLWFAAGAFIFSTGQYYLAPMASDLTPLVGGLAVSITATAAKFA